MEQRYKIRLKSAYTAEVGGEIISGEVGDVISVPREYVAALIRLDIADPAGVELDICRRLLEAASSFSDREVAAIVGLDAIEVAAIRREMGV